MTNAPPELVLIVPVYNEADAIVPVLAEWRAELERTVGKGRYLILVVDDGSRDETPARLAALDWPELRVHTHANRGHGQSCLVGYIEAERIGAPYLFQIDSDGQCDPAYFAKVWEPRGRAASVYGRRTSRDDGPARRVVSAVLRASLKLARGTKLNDTNVPYRLYRTPLAAAAARRIPADFNLANIAMALLLEPEGFAEVPIHFRDRTGGHPSVSLWGFAPKALRLHRDLARLGR
ncbi:MAG TPA: glycosyltransferase family 2 protein [Opitutaceae bacterium]|jgi:dolichol-phosphate mannosyltransferase